MTSDPNSTSFFDDVFTTRSIDEWETLARKTLPDNQSIEDLATKTLAGLDIKALYSEHSAEQNSASASMSVSSSNASIDNRFRVTDHNATEANKSVLDGLIGGATSYELEIDDQSSAGLTSSSLPKVLEGVYLDVAPVSLVAGNSTMASIEQIEQLWHDQNIQASAKLATFNLDPLDTYFRGQIPDDAIATSLNNLAQLTKQYSTESPDICVASVNVSRHHNSGASATQELVAAIATATPYAEAIVGAGSPIESVCNNIEFRVSCDSDFLMTVVKLRALKKLWSAVCLGLEPNLKFVGCRIAAETSQRMQATTSPWVNHLRNTASCAAAMVGGAASISVIPHNCIANQWIDNEKDLGVRMARNLPIILEQECLLTSVDDPMAGSYAVETLTNELVSIAWQQLLELEQSGGWMNELSSGRWHNALTATHDARVEALKADKNIRVGVNRFQADENVISKASNNSEPCNFICIPTPVRDAESFGA